MSGRSSSQPAAAALRLARSAERFCTPEGEVYVSLRRDDHRETYAVTEHGGGFRRWLRGSYFRETGRALSQSVLADVSATVAAMAQAEGVVHPVFTRVAANAGSLYLDLGDAAWRVVQVDDRGWRIVAEPPVRFRRPRGMLPLPEPLPGGDLAELRRFVNVAGETDARLLTGWLLAALRPTGPYPILALHGERGCAKSTVTRLLRALIDPAVPPSRDLPKEPRDLAISARNAWVLAFDNLSRLPEWLSDALCRLATGGGFATRKLHTDDEESLFWAQRPIVMNGIEELATRGDLLDRALVITLPVIPPEARREEAALEREFAGAHGRLLGALLTATAEAVRRLPTTTPAALPRMADFARWMAAAETGLGWSPGTFAAAYGENQRAAVGLEIEASPVGQAIQRLAVVRVRWQGTATELQEELAGVCPELMTTFTWPKGPRALSGALRRVAPGLRALGIAVEMGRSSEHDRTRVIRIGSHPEA